MVCGKDQGMPQPGRSHMLCLFTDPQRAAVAGCYRDTLVPITNLEDTPRAGAGFVHAFAARSADGQSSHLLLCFYVEPITGTASRATWCGGSGADRILSISSCQAWPSSIKANDTRIYWSVWGSRSTPMGTRAVLGMNCGGQGWRRTGASSTDDRGSRFRARNSEQKRSSDEVTIRMRVGACGVTLRQSAACRDSFG